MQSESIAKIAMALSGFQSQVYAIGKDSRGHGYTYTSLGHATQFLYPVMSKCGLSVCQMLGEHEGKPALHTTLMHTSGEWIRGVYPLEPVGLKVANNAQQFGAAVTYARRYALLACLGVAADDDDAACLTKTVEEEVWDQAKTDARDAYKTLAGIAPGRAKGIMGQFGKDYPAMLSALNAAIEEIEHEQHNALADAGGQ